jgi:hypothetical protein
MNPRPYDFSGAKPNRKKAFLVGDAVPKPLGFTALPPEWLSSGRLTPPRHSGRWVGARVASLRCLILRPGEVQYKPGGVPKEDPQKVLAETMSVR